MALHCYPLFAISSLKTENFSPLVQSVHTAVISAWCFRLLHHKGISQMLAGGGFGWQK